MHALWSSSLLWILLLLPSPSLLLAVFTKTRQTIACPKSYKRISIAALLVSVFNRFAVRVCMIDINAFFFDFDTDVAAAAAAAADLVAVVVAVTVARIVAIAVGTIGGVCRIVLLFCFPIPLDHGMLLLLIYYCCYC